MRLPRTQTTLAAVLLLSTAPFALAAPPGTTPANTPGVTPPETTPSTTNPDVTPSPANPSATAPEAASPSATRPGTASPGGAVIGPGMSQSRSERMQGGSSMSSSHWGHSHMGLRSAARVPQADINAAKSARVSLTDAINTAQQGHGNVISARFELRQGKPEYLVKTFNSDNQQMWIGHIDANTGQVMGEGRTIPLTQVPKEERQKLTASQKAGTTLAQAVQTAEQQSGGKALAAGLTARNGQVSYRTQILKSNGSTQMAMINPKSGQVSSYR